VNIARSYVMPAALRHQALVATAVASTKAAGLDASDTVVALRELVMLVSELRRATTAVEQVAAHHVDDPEAHARQISKQLRPAMVELRKVVDTLETIVSADLWPLPTYRDLLFIK